MDQLVIEAARIRLNQMRHDMQVLEQAIREAEHRTAPKKKDRRLASTGGRNLSPEARQRIADAQKKRWANFRKEKAA